MFASGGQTLCVITGASRGFGRAVALALARDFSDMGSEGQFVLVSRSEDGLEETKNQMKASFPSQKVSTVIADLAEVSTLEETFSKVLDKARSTSVTHALLVNNAASLGDISSSLKNLSLEAGAIQSYFDLNLTSPMFLIKENRTFQLPVSYHCLWVLTGRSKFLQAFKNESCTVVNVSSLFALQSSPCFSLYCTGKAARDMMCQVVAEEEPSVRILNYAPGPLLTEMYDQICAASGNLEIKQMFVESKEQGKVLSPDESARKLLRILKENTYQSGTHIDYYDY